MEVCVSLAGGATAYLESLDAWLRQEPGLGGRVRLVRSAPRPGELGSLAEALVVAVGSGGTVSVLAASLGGWLSQPRRSEVKLKVRGSGGRVVEITAQVKADQAEALLRQALETAEG